MTICGKAIALLRASAHECEKAIGTEYADVYTAKHLATLETILELAEDGNVGSVTITAPDPFVAVNASQEQVNLDEDVEEVTVEQEVEAELENHDKYRQVMEMREKSIKVADIAKAMNCSVNAVYNYLKCAREMENK